MRSRCGNRYACGVLTKSPKAVHQDSSAATADGRTDETAVRPRRGGREERGGKKPALRDAELATRQSQKLAGKNPPSSRPLEKKNPLKGR